MKFAYENYHLIYVLDTLHAACGLDVNMGLVFPQQPCIVRYYPSGINITVKFVISFDPCKHRPVGWTTIYWISISFHLGLLTVRKWELL